RGHNHYSLRTFQSMNWFKSACMSYSHCLKPDAWRSLFNNRPAHSPLRNLCDLRVLAVSILKQPLTAETQRTQRKRREWNFVQIRGYFAKPFSTSYATPLKRFQIIKMTVG